MKVLENTRYRFVMEHGPLKNVIFFSVLNTFFAIGIAIAYENGQLFRGLMLALCFALSTYLAANLVGRYRLTFDRNKHQAILSQWGMHLPKQSQFDLSDINAVHVEEIKGTYRLRLALNSLNRGVALTPHFIAGRRMVKAAEAANAWLVSSALMPR